MRNLSAMLRAAYPFATSYNTLLLVGKFRPVAAPPLLPSSPPPPLTLLVTKHPSYNARRRITPLETIQPLPSEKLAEDRNPYFSKSPMAFCHHSSATFP